MDAAEPLRRLLCHVARVCGLAALGISLLPLVNWVCLITITALSYHVLGAKPHWIYECRVVESTRYAGIYNLCMDTMGYFGRSPYGLVCLPIAWAALPLATWIGARKLFLASIVMVTFSLLLVFLFLLSAFAPGPFEWYWA